MTKRWAVWGDRAQRRTMLCLLLMAGIAMAVEGLGVAYLFVTDAQAKTSTDSFVRTMESVLGMSPGKTKPILQCQCSIKYVGTEIRPGHEYAVIIRKLD